MTRATVVVSFLIHAGVATALMTAATQGERRKAISVAVSSAKKKAEPPKPPPPAPVPRRAPRVVATAPKPAAVTEAPKPVARAAVATALAMSNDDAPGGIALGGPAAGGVGSGGGVAPTRVASAVSSARTRRTREALGEGGSVPGESAGGGEAPCTEEPTKPVPVSKTDLEYTVAAKTEGIEGKLKLKLTVAADGSVSDVEVLASVEPALDQVAVAAARQWRFKPAMLCDKPVAGGTYVLQKRYELTD